jgi:predicted transcriptional regulator
MDIQALKIDLVQRILNSQDTALLSTISNMIEKEVEKDWWDQLPQEVRNAVFEGLDDIEKGKVFTNDQVIQEVKQKYGF